jgi:hypothetical protein
MFLFLLLTFLTQNIKKSLKIPKGKMQYHYVLCYVCFFHDPVHSTLFVIQQIWLTLHATQWPKDTKGVIRIRKSKKNRQHSGQKIPKGGNQNP